MTRFTGILAVLGTGVMFGFFFAWTLTMWGLDRTEPAAAIASMRAINASIRNPLFFAAFLAAPALTGLAALAALVRGSHRQALLLGIALVVLLSGVIAVTATGNVPLNEMLAAVELPASDPGSTWRAYSAPWQSFNVIRTLASGSALALAAIGLAVRTSGSGGEIVKIRNS